ncbi:MAG: type I-E CRISPR-associated protein Cse1/CasA [Lachnospiraceae bacterium]|nr:type I-E CRISPR-associated protein Cse1/CasA [Lachnospiraceae bacterium]
MSVTYNVIEQPWIPVVTVDGKNEELGIRKVIQRADALREISCASPLEEYSLYRFLGLFLMDALRPETDADIEDLIDEGRFDTGTIDAYITDCEKEGVSFDLFDGTRPFLQSPPGENEGGIKPVSALDFTLPSGNNHTHFGHAKMIPKDMDPGDALRLILVSYLFCTAGVQEYPSGVYGAPPYFGVVKGRNLFETLVYTLLPLQKISIPFDKPPVLWRRIEPIIPKGQVGSTSWLLGMLFPTRRIRLVPDGHGRVTGTYFSQGENFVNTESWHDPYVTYYLKEGKTEKKLILIRPSGGNGIWRNLCDIIDKKAHLASILLSQYKDLWNEPIINLTLYGTETDQASYLDIFRYDLSFPGRLMEDERISNLLKNCVARAEDMAGALSGSMRSVKAFSDASAATEVQKYYSDCEKAFWGLVGQLEKMDPAGYKNAYISFCDEIGKNARQCYQDACKAVTLRAKDLVMVEEQRKILNLSIHKLQKEASE